MLLGFEYVCVVHFFDDPVPLPWSILAYGTVLWVMYMMGRVLVEVFVRLCNDCMGVVAPEDVAAGIRCN